MIFADSKSSITNICEIIDKEGNPGLQLVSFRNLGRKIDFSIYMDLYYGYNLINSKMFFIFFFLNLYLSIFLLSY